jgi:hypothetical protein
VKLTPAELAGTFLKAFAAKHRLKLRSECNVAWSASLILRKEVHSVKSANCQQNRISQPRKPLDARDGSAL